MPLSKSLKKQKNSPVPAPPAIPAAGGRKGRLMTTFDDLFSAAFGKFQAKSISYTNLGGRK